MVSTPAAETGSLYRKYRPKAFADIEGQGAEVKAVARAVAAGNPNHAYLLTGPRGTGKTSTARLIAMGLNCSTDGPTAAPCGTCYNCESIAAGNAMDVLELDAASNNSVDNIRDLRNKTSVVPAFGAFRVYILDEAHMLSKAAWNALLKTLEEPPPSTVFVLCTTESKAVPGTVESRCQEVHFRAPTADQLAKRVNAVADAEGVSIEPGAAALLGRAARGAYRDALKLLEQAVALADAGAVTEAVVRGLLGSEEEQQMFAALNAVAAGDAAKAITAAARVAADADPDVVLRELEGLARDVLITATVKRLPKSLQTTPERDALVKAAAGKLGTTGAARLMDEIAWALMAVRAGADPRARLELALVKAADPVLAPPTSEQTLRRLDRVEAAVMSQHGSRRPLN